MLLTGLSMYLVTKMRQILSCTVLGSHVRKVRKWSFCIPQYENWTDSLFSLRHHLHNLRIFHYPSSTCKWSIFVHTITWSYCVSLSV